MSGVDPPAAATTDMDSRSIEERLVVPAGCVCRIERSEHHPSAFFWCYSRLCPVHPTEHAAYCSAVQPVFEQMAKAGRKGRQKRMGGGIAGVGAVDIQPS